MKNLKLELFNFKKDLSIDQYEIATIVEGHIAGLVELSEKMVINSLNEKLKPYSYDKSVVDLLEGLKVDMADNELLYELKHLYTVLEKKNQGMIYRQPINVLLQTISVEDEQERLSMVLNELALYNWVPEIKVFVSNLTSNTEQKVNLLSGGSAESIFTIVESVEAGHVALVAGSWFLLSEDKIEKVLLPDHVEGEALTTLRTLESALNYSTIENECINFKLSEYLTLGVSVEKGTLYINDEELEANATLESLFNSPIIPLVNRQFYPIVVETVKNLSKFVELDVVKKVNNLINPYLELYAFNYKNNIFVYRVDERYGNSFYKYDSALELVSEVRNELNFDLTYFYENMMNKETVTKRKLEDKEKQIALKLEEVNTNIDKLNASIKMIGETETLTSALNTLTTRAEVLKENLDAVKLAMYNQREKLS